MAAGHYEKAPWGQLKKTSLQQLSAWTLHVWRAVSFDTIVRSFKVTTPSNCIRGTEDDRLWEDGNKVTFSGAMKADTKLSDNETIYDVSSEPLLPPAAVAGTVRSFTPPSSD